MQYLLHERSCGIGLQNGRLIAVGEAELFDVMITADQSIWYQQNSTNRKIALVVLNTNNWEQIASRVDLVRDAIVRSHPGSYELLEVKALR